jgi:hypothetical protein
MVNHGPIPRRNRSRCWEKIDELRAFLETKTE